MYFGCCHEVPVHFHVSTYIQTIEVETSALELGSKQAMASLTDQVSKPALANLMAVKTKAVKMNTRAVRFKEEMERILQDNEEMAEMFLTRRAHMDTVLAEQQGALQSTPSTAEAAAAALAEGPEGRSEGGTQGGFQGGPFAGAALEREPSMHPQASMGSVGSPPSSRGFVRTSTIRRPLRSPTVTPGRGLRSVTMPADGGAVSGKHAGLVLASDELGQMALVQAIGDVEDMLEVCVEEKGDVEGGWWLLFGLVDSSRCVWWGCIHGVWWGCIHGVCTRL